MFKSDLVVGALLPIRAYSIVINALEAYTRFYYPEVLNHESYLMENCHRDLDFPKLSQFSVLL